MPKFYDKYCYPSNDEAFTAFTSETFINNQPVTYRSLSGSVVSFETVLQIDSVPHVQSGSFTFTDCTMPGPVNNSTGLTIDDAVSLSWLIVTVWAVAWGLKQIRRFF